MYWRRRLTRLESALYAGVAAVLVGIFVERSFYLMALAERSAMEVTVQRINTGLRLRRATEIIAGTVPAAAAPGDLFAFAYVTPPPNAQPGAWRYDPAGSALVYTPQYRRALAARSPDGTIRFRLMRDTTGLWVLAPAADF